jgi:DNA-binding MarR family transcriptional regulator
VTALPDLDPVIHAAARLKVSATLAALSPGDQISFPRLQKLLDMTAGNLSTHLRKLQDAGYVAVLKTHEGRIPATYIALTVTGRRALEDYTAALRQLLAPAADNRQALGG